MPDKDNSSRTFIERMRAQFTAACEAERDIRAEAVIDMRFRAGEQWDERAKRTREAANRPALVFNKTHQFVAQVANEARKNKATVKFSPVDDSADVDTAKVCEELARAIQYNSDADVAYEHALDPAVGSSFGFFRLVTDYCDDETDDQEIKFAPILDPLSVYGVLVPSAFRRPVPFAFVCETLSKEEYEAKYPDSDLGKQWGLDGDYGFHGGDWIAKDTCRVAEYWWVEWERRKNAAGRVVQVPHVKSCVTNGIEVMPNSETEWAGSTIPIFAVLGSQLVIDGKLHLFSVIRFIRDPQVLINVCKTRIAETLMTQPISPFIGPAGFMRGREQEWQSLNTRLTSAIEYEVVDAAGKPLPEPKRQVYEPPIGALSGFVQQEVDDLKEGTGIYDAARGARSNETSGVAIERRTRQAETSNFHFLDNLTRAQKEAGRALAEIMPKIYDTPRWVRIIGEDETERMARVNEPYVDSETGEQKSYLLGAGKYDVRVVTGPSFTTKRQETADLMAGAIQAAPQLLAVIGDHYFRNLDAAGAEQMAERMKRWIASQSPGLIEDEKKGQPEIPPEVQQKLQQSGQMVEQLTQALNEAQGKLEAKQPELESRERTEAAKLEVEREKIAADLEMKRMDIAAKAAQIQSQEAIEQLRQEIELLKSRQSADREDERAERDREFTRETTQGAGTDAAVGE